MFAVANSPDAELAWIMNAGALAILGYHLIVGLPKMFSGMLAAQKESVLLIVQGYRDERASFEVRAKAIAEEVAKLRDKPGCKLPDGWSP